jgi:hypothetical protein
MSADNCILIHKNENGFFIFDKNMESFEMGYQIGIVDSLEEAIQLAKIYMSENIVEYGIQFEGI